MWLSSTSSFTGPWCALGPKHSAVMRLPTGLKTVAEPCTSALTPMMADAKRNSRMGATLIDFMMGDSAYGWLSLCILQTRSSPWGFTWICVPNHLL